MSRYAGILKKLNKEIETLEAKLAEVKDKLDKKKKERDTVQTLDDGSAGSNPGEGPGPRP